MIILQPIRKQSLKQSLNDLSVFEREWKYILHALRAAVYITPALKTPFVLADKTRRHSVSSERACLVLIRLLSQIFDSKWLVCSTLYEHRASEHEKPLLSVLQTPYESACLIKTALLIHYDNPECTPEGMVKLIN